MTDYRIAELYIRKSRMAKQKGHQFSLSLMSFSNLMKAKYCAYTGIQMTEAADSACRPTDRTLDRIDNKKGYVKGNVCAVSYAANCLKAVWENPENHLNIERVEMMIKKIKNMENVGK